MFDFLNDYTDRLFKREAPEEDYNSFFKRLDVDEFFSYLNNLWAPNELMERMGGRGNLDKLYKDPEIYAAWDKRQAAILDTKLMIEGKSDDVVKFFMDQLAPHEVQLKRDFQWSVPYGYGVEQIIYDEDRSGSVVGFQREQFWRFEPMSDLMHVKLTSTTNTDLLQKLMPYGKWILTTNNGSYFNPYGEAMFERLIQPWIFKCNGADLWMDFAKRFANGFMHAKIEDVKQKDMIRKELEKAGKSSVIVTSKTSDLTMIQASRDSSLYKDIEDRTVQSIQRVILGETLSSGMLDRGSSGAASVHDEVRWEKIMSDIRIAEKSFNETIKQIAYVNEIDNKAIPTAKLIIDAGLNKELADRDASLAGQVKFTKKYYVNNYGFKDDEFEVLETPKNPFENFRQKKKTTYLSPTDVKEYLGIDENCPKCSTNPIREVKLSPNVRRKTNRQLVEKEDTVSFLNRNGESPIDVADLSSAILNSKSEKELDENLNALFNQDNTDFVDLLTDTFYYTATKGAILANPKKLKPGQTDEEE